MRTHSRFSLLKVQKLGKTQYMYSGFRESWNMGTDRQPYRVLRDLCTTQKARVYENCIAKSCARMILWCKDRAKHCSTFPLNTRAQIYSWF